MATPVSLFDYDLPESFIAQHSVEPRDQSKLMLVARRTGQTAHTIFADIVDQLLPGDVLVFNTSKVFKARLIDGGVEMFILKILDQRLECLLKPGKKFPVGATLKMFGQDFVVEEKFEDGVVTMKTSVSAVDMLAFCDAHGQIPTPPYVKQTATDKEYQTVYAKQVGSVAAPTAGFHFTDELLEKIRAKGVQIEEVVLHVGIGTFRPVQVDNIEEHRMHSEWVSVSADTADRINVAKREGRRVIAVGTTTTRVLEGLASQGARIPLRSGRTEGGSLLSAFEGELNIFITPGYDFKVIDGLITNFHLPKSTLLMLVSAFAGREHVLTAYEEAKQKGYRFFSFGDAMFIR